MPDRRKYAGRAAMLLLASVLAAAGCRGGAAAGGAPAPDASPEEHASVDPQPVTGLTALECGQPFRARSAGALTVTGWFPTTAPVGGRMVTGAVEVTSREAIGGVVNPRADAFLVRAGRVATVPLPQDSIGVRWDLAPGETRRLPGDVTLASCEPGGGSVGPGTYELYARVVFTPDDGAAVESFGGPWPIDVR